MEQIESQKAEIEELTSNNEELEAEIKDILQQLGIALCGEGTKSEDGFSSILPFAIRAIKDIPRTEEKNKKLIEAVEKSSNLYHNSINKIAEILGLSSEKLHSADTVFRKAETIVRECAAITVNRNRFCSSVNRIADILGFTGKQCYSPDAVERKAKAIVREAAHWKSRVDNGETWDELIEKVSGLLTSEGKDRLKRLSNFMKWGADQWRKVAGLERREIELDLEAEHLGKTIDVLNETLRGINILRGNVITQDELVELMASCFTDPNKRSFFPASVVDKLPKEVTEDSALKLALENFAQSVHVELFRRDQKILNTVYPPVTVTVPDSNLDKGTLENVRAFLGGGEREDSDIPPPDIEVRAHATEEDLDDGRVQVSVKIPVEEGDGNGEA